MVVVTMNYFLMSYSDDAFFGYAKTPKEFDRTILLETGFIADWKNPEFFLTKGELADYLNCDISWPLFSAALRSIVEAFARNQEEIQWLEVGVNNGDKITPYFVPHLIVKPDILDSQKSFFGPGNLLIKPVFDKKKIGSRDIFTHRKRRFTLYVSDMLRKKVEQSKISGCHFEKTRVF
jgi:hypothetical protein